MLQRAWVDESSGYQCVANMILSYQMKPFFNLSETINFLNYKYSCKIKEISLGGISMDDYRIKSLAVAIGRNNPNGIGLLGTGFFIGNNLIATTKHVTNGDEHNLVIILPKYSIDEYQDTSDTGVQVVKATIKNVDPIRDLCIIEIEDAQLNIQVALGSTDDVQTGSPVAVLGYPHADHGRLVLTQQYTQIGAKILIESHTIKTKHIVLNTQARPGQSGGPIIDMTTGSIIGMLIGSYAPGGGGGISLGGVDPHTLHQTTHVISAEYISEMIVE